METNIWKIGVRNIFKNSECLCFLGPLDDFSLGSESDSSEEKLQSPFCAQSRLWSPVSFSVPLFLYLNLSLQIRGKFHLSVNSFGHSTKKS